MTRSRNIPRWRWILPAFAALALTAPAGFTAVAQDAGDERPDRKERRAERDGERKERGERKRQGAMKALFKDVNLTETQREEVRTIMAPLREEMEAWHAKAKEVREASRAAMKEAREAGDREAAQAARDKAKAEMEALLEERPKVAPYLDEVRDVLTADQQATFDSNRETIEAKMAERREQVKDKREDRRERRSDRREERGDRPERGGGPE
ncbi:MAG: Spy/CpxP family protein refolding chaperone [Planctomycetota bacterium]